MNIPAISAYSARTNTKPVSFGKIDMESIEYPVPITSQGKLTFNDISANFKYRICKVEGVPSTGFLTVKDPKKQELVEAVFHFKDNDLAKPEISSESCFYQDSSNIDQGAQEEFIKDANTIAILASSL